MLARHDLINGSVCVSSGTDAILRKGQGNNEVISGGCVGNREENRRFPIPDAVKLQFVIRHDLPELGDVKGGQPGAAGNKDRFCCLARDEKSRTLDVYKRQEF